MGEHIVKQVNIRNLLEKEFAKEEGVIETIIPSTPGCLEVTLYREIKVTTEVINVRELVERELLKKGLTIYSAPAGLPESLEIECRPVDRPFEMNNAVYESIYPWDAFYKPDVETIAQKMMESFHDLSVKEQGYVKRFIAMKISPAAKTKKKAELLRVSKRAWEEFDADYNKAREDAKFPMKKMKAAFSKSYRPVFLTYTLDQIKELKREDFVVMTRAWSHPMKLVENDSKIKDFPWSSMLTYGPENWPDEKKLKEFREYYFKQY